MKNERTWTIDGVAMIFHLSATTILRGFDTYSLYSHADLDRVEPLLEILHRISHFPIVTFIESVAMVCYFDAGYGSDVNTVLFLIGSIAYVIYAAVHAFLFGQLCLAVWKAGVWAVDWVKGTRRDSGECP